MRRFGQFAATVGACLVGGAAGAQPADVCVDMLALGEPVCDVVAAEVQVGAASTFVPDGAGSALENALELQVGLSEATTLAVRVDSALPLGHAAGHTEVGGVAAHLFWILARSEDHRRGLALGADLAKPPVGGPATQLGLDGTLLWDRVALFTTAGAAVALDPGAPTVDAYASASFAVRIGEVAALFEVRAEGGDNPLHVDVAPGFTWHPTEDTKLLVAAPLGYDAAGWSAAVQISFAATWALESEAESIAVAAP